MRSFNDELTPREWAEYNNNKEMWELGATHAERLKRLDIEQEKLSAKWTSWLKLPYTLLMLPVYVVFSIAFVVAQITKKELPPEFWRLFKL